MAAEDFAYLARDGPIARKIRGQEHSVRTEMFGAHGGHSGTHAELSGLVRSSANHRAVPAPRDNDGLAAQLWIIPLLDGCVECVHVDVHDFAGWHIWTILGLARVPPPIWITKPSSNAHAAKPLPTSWQLSRETWHTNGVKYTKRCRTGRPTSSASNAERSSTSTMTMLPSKRRAACLTIR